MIRTISILEIVAAALLLAACAPTEKIITIPGPEVVRLVPAKIDPRLTECMDVEPPSVDLIPIEMPPEKVAAVLGVLAQRYKMAWQDCRGKVEAIRRTQAAQP